VSRSITDEHRESIDAVDEHTESIGITGEHRESIDVVCEHTESIGIFLYILYERG